MADNTISPNMNLIIPTAGQEPGPTYAFDVNASLTLIDQHDHTPGKGVQITPSGLNINTDLSFNSNKAIDLASAVFIASTTADVTPMSLSVAPGGESPQQQDLWFTPDTGIPIQITKNGAVNATVASIPGESYASGTFFWTQAQDSLPTTPANFDIGSITIRPNTAATSNGVVLGPPTGISSQFNVQLPLLPTSQKIMTLDSGGNMAAPYTVDGSTITIASNVIGVPAGGITNTQIAMNTITGNRLVNQTIAYDQLASGFNGTWNYTELTITTPSFNVRVATVVNGALATAFENGDTVDGVVLATSDKILLKNQTASTENGVYTVNASGAPTRDPSYDTFSELNYAGVHVTAGTVNTNTDWFQNNILTSLSDAQSWSKNQTIAFTVPAIGVNELIIEGSGSGGGGGGGGGSGATRGQGGAGGAGATPQRMRVNVTGGQLLNALVAFKGLGGTAGAGTPTAGGNGGDGTASTLTGSGVDLYFPGGSGGLGGAANSTTATANTTTYTVTMDGALSVGIGGGSNSLGNVAGVSANRTPLVGNPATGGAAGGATTRGTAGGGGGSGFAKGGNGGAAAGSGSGSANPGVSAASTAYGGAGGGGSGGTPTTDPGAAGGNGANGVIRIYWLGNPS